MRGAEAAASSQVLLAPRSSSSARAGALRVEETPTRLLGRWALVCVSPVRGTRGGRRRLGSINP